MSAGVAATGWRRRARPLLGTLVEVGLRDDGPAAAAAVEAAFDTVRELQACLSRYVPGSDIARFAALRRGGWLTLHPAARAVFAAAQQLRDASAGAFDISLGSAPFGWQFEAGRLHKLDAAARLDLGGIGKGRAIDSAVEALIAHRGRAGWVNAGGDLRAFGDVDVPVVLRDEVGGGVRTFAWLRDGAFATSRYGPGSRCQLAGGAPGAPAHRHVSVAAPLALWADALTKLVALRGDVGDPLLARHDAQAWLH